MAGVPLPLSLNDIELYLASRTILIDRIEFDSAILALDDAWRAEWAEEQKKHIKRDKLRRSPGFFIPTNMKYFDILRYYKA
ncbi:hypothetical protein AWN63_14055 [Klebsiella variicola]|uniref:hypothetical protein n=1 Tax=Klebsiella variicola TaxID=244366 RepID=UPI000BC0818A|nr:hypothetical protein [Klebsiella variicola]APW88483.1 hypothetical protein AWN63_14055 [Klebsiella variicola]